MVTARRVQGLRLNTLGAAPFRAGSRAPVPRAKTTAARITTAAGVGRHRILASWPRARCLSRRLRRRWHPCILRRWLRCCGRRLLNRGRDRSRGGRRHGYRHGLCWCRLRRKKGTLGSTRKGVNDLAPCHAAAGAGPDRHRRAGRDRPRDLRHASRATNTFLGQRGRTHHVPVRPVQWAGR